MFRLLYALFLICFATVAPAAPEGAVRVIDADTFDIGGTRVRLFGIDAPEIGQPCDADGAVWDCGRWARDQVRDQFENAWAVCTQQDVDRYDRVVAICHVGGVDMGAEIVNAGWAWAYLRYSDRYALDEKAAAVHARGLWSLEVERAAAYRQAQAAGPTAPDPNCTIKGNISDNGHIYHLPGSAVYQRTAINTGRGERWFCTAHEAEAAGWRAARGG
ncbi:thermonuclease family protein [Yoonia sp. BS5-3]|uniref:Thermonuclease family protein n=1 Tax=Yoonia phaeophyticola TaxID=3137369 RepID=A0ABZ2VC01_9RHOB